MDLGVIRVFLFVGCTARLPIGSLSFDCDAHSLLLPEGLADGYVSQGCLFGEDALAGGTLDLFDVLCATKAAQF